jgi:Tol biopolymer transport system component
MMHRLAAGSVLALLALHFAPAQTQSNDHADSLVFEQPSNQWFEGPSTQVTVSDDGKWALFTQYGRALRVVSLSKGTEDAQRLAGGLDSVEGAAFCGGGRLARLGERGSDKGWFLPAGQDLKLSSLPADAVLQCSANGSEMAYHLAGDPDQGLFIGRPGDFKNYGVAGRVTAMTFSPDGSALYVLMFRSNGDSSLVRILVHSLNTKTIASDLDASPFPGNISLSADGKSLFLPLASPGAPNNEARHKPNAPRWLKIYQLDLATGDRQPVVESDNQDNFGPTLVGENLYWTRNVSHNSVVLVPTGGGDARELVSGGQVPMWNPDGKQISYTFGDWRLADWALNLDVAAIDMDADGRRASQPVVIVAGYHEDFPAAWSPDGRWIAFHSHRSKTPVPEYSSLGSSDDIYLRQANDVHAPEMRLTEFGWETGPAYWSPDGRKLMFSSWEKGGQPGIDKVWIITLDPESGRVFHTDPLPLRAAIRSAEWTAWSPDGKEIAIEDNRGGEDRSIWIVHSDGSAAQKLLDYKATTYGGLAWTPDGKTIVYSGLAGDRMQLFGVPRTGGAPVQLSHDAGNLMHPSVSPDGQWIACTRIVQSQQIMRRPLS